MTRISQFAAYMTQQGSALRMLAEITARQWGMVTSAQAGLQGVTRLDLSRLTEAGHFERIAHGVYMDAGAPGDQFDELRAAWLGTDPKAMGEARIKDRENGVVVAGASAARLHDIGDLWADRHEFVSPDRRQSQRTEVRYRQRTLDPADVMLVEGLPSMTVERTIADLVEEVGDLSLVADALGDASYDLDLARLRELLSPLAERNGFRKGDGSALLDHLMEIAGIDVETLARQIAADTSLGSRVAANYLNNLKPTDFGQFFTHEMQKNMSSVLESFATQISTSPKFAEINATMGLALANLYNSAALKPETLTAVRKAREAKRT